MKTFRKELWFKVKKRRELINITPQVEECVRESGIREGLILCNAMHITASIFINDDEPGLHQDFEIWLEKLAPAKRAMVGAKSTVEMGRLIRSGRRSGPANRKKTGTRTDSW